jgi:hypothetical protein
MTIETFLERISQRGELPNNPLARIQVLARELAEGAASGLWQVGFDSFDIQRGEKDTNSQNLASYFDSRWNGLDNAPHFSLLVRNAYLEAEEQGRYTSVYAITKAAFDLLNISDAASIFVSYKRSESSAFALLVANVLRQAGLAPFVDMQLEAGGDWREQLRKTIEKSDYLILLLGNETLHSEVTLQEIKWAQEAETTIIPIWHNGFGFKAAEWPKLDAGLKDLLANTHTIRVTEENPLAYNTALTELLNRFGMA